MKAGTKAFLTREVGSVTVVQMIAMAVSLILAGAVLSVGGMGYNPLGWLLVAVILYIIPHLVGTIARVKAVYGMFAALVLIILGGMVIGPAFVDSIDGVDGKDGGAFENVTYTLKDDGSVHVEAVLATEPQHGAVVNLRMVEVSFVSFKSMVAGGVVDNNYFTENLHAGTHITMDIPAHDTSKLWDVYLMLDVPDGTLNPSDERSYEFSSMAPDTVTKDVYTGSMKIYVAGATYTMLFILVVFYMILLFSAIIRRTIKGKRGRLEEEGRLYPQGYGRCSNCGSIVLPGEVECRKCGAYIDRPDQMKPKKVDYFVCDNCGSEVAYDAKVCPKCGEKFDGVETEVRNPDGSVEITEGSKDCPKCGRNLPSNAEFCPKCGHKFL